MRNKKNQFIIFLVMFTFFGAILVHSEHYAELGLEAPSLEKSPDCFFCLQSLDSPSKYVILASFVTVLFSLISIELFSVNFILPTYLLALLRAPPYITL